MTATRIQTEPVAAGTSWRSVIATTVRLLTFRATHEDLVNVHARHLIFGVLCAWTVGIGRFWDNTRAGLFLHSGLGSVVYVFVLSLMLWLIVWPLKPKNWSYFRVAVFVSLVSPPAIIYAIPVEKFYSIDTANSINVWFLTIVAAWRVALLFFFLRKLGELNWFEIITASLLPLTLIIVILAMLNLERVVFNFMGGLSERSGNDAAYEVLFGLSLISFVLFVPSLICYIALVFSKYEAVRQERLWKKYDQ
jgi:hypothetical protein